MKHLALLLPLVVLTACTSVEETFPGRDPSHVWSALVAVAQTPEYETTDQEEWQVKENVVWIDDPAARIEVYRELTRIEDLTSVEPDVDVRTWRFQVTLDQTDPPVATFVSRGRAWPTHAKQEARRFFREVRDLLGGAPMDEDEEARTGGEVGADMAGGATTPEEAVRELLHAMFINDEQRIRAITLAAPDLEILWTGETAEEFLPAEAQPRLEERRLRPAEVGETIEMFGEPFVVTEEMLDEDHQIIVAEVAGEELAPFLLVRTESGLWKVDPEPIIYRRQRGGGL